MEAIIDELEGFPPGKSVIVSGENGLYVPCLRDVLHFYSTPGNSYDVRVVSGSAFGGSDPPPFAEFVYQTPTGVNYDKRMYHTRCKVKSVLDEACTSHLTDKRMMYDIFRKANPFNHGFYLPTTVPLSGFGFGKEGGKGDDKGGESASPTQSVYIVKATGRQTGCGRGNFVVTSEQDVTNAIAKMQERGYDPSSAVVSRYITNPVLFEGRKTHFRTFVMLTGSGGVPAASTGVSVFDRVVVRLAKEPYSNSEWDNSDIHDTHTSSSGVDIYLPILSSSSSPSSSSSEDRERERLNRRRIPKRYSRFQKGDILQHPERYEHLNQYYQLAIDATKSIAAVMQRTTSAKPPPEATNAFEVFALDLIITSSPSPRVFLLEINTKVSYRSALSYGGSGVGSSVTTEDEPTEEHVAFSSDYFTWIYREGYLPFSEPRTYSITGGTGLQLHHLDERLSSYGWVRLRDAEVQHIVSSSTSSRKSSTDERQAIFFNYLEKMTKDLRRFNPSAVQAPCHYKNILPPTKMCIADKGLLHQNMGQVYPECVAESWVGCGPDLGVDGEEKNTLLFIIRPIGDVADSGKGVVVCPGSALQEAISGIKARIDTSEGLLTSFIVSRYITDPLLYEERKYHLRSFFLYRTGEESTSQNARPRWSVFERSRIVTAKLPYIQGDWTNPLIHDTHSKSTPFNIFADTPSSPDFMRMIDALGEIMMRHHIVPYPESKVGYEVFGLDILPTPRGYILMEVNSRVGMKDLGDAPQALQKDTFSQFSQDYFDWMLKVAF